jgi:hypothetical protein
VAQTVEYCSGKLSFLWSRGAEIFGKAGQVSYTLCPRETRTKSHESPPGSNFRVWRDLDRQASMNWLSGLGWKKFRWRVRDFRDIPQVFFPYSLADNFALCSPPQTPGLPNRLGSLFDLWPFLFCLALCLVMFTSSSERFGSLMEVNNSTD